ncbi:Enhancer of polycomb-like, N-terminal [Dillenia turbinata]|uniref:Enhancer of polycomb-like protein n=1 Tax=Dillenia turbinata TaxID=194707 RepID=A0AAN8VG78_9MAGN
MPSVGMRRSTRIFVPKSAQKVSDGGRVLRSGRRVLSNNNDDWIRLIDSDDIPNLKKTRIHNKVVSKPEIVNVALPQPKKVADDRNQLNVGNVVDKFYGLVYHRKRKRRDGKKVEDDKKRFGIQFSRKQRRKRAKSQVEGGGAKDGLMQKDVFQSHFLGVVVESHCNVTSELACFLNYVLRYLARTRLTLSELRGFVFSEPISSVFASKGIHFLWDTPCYSASGFCKIFEGVRFVPMFAVDFSAVPSCFLYLHACMLLGSMSSQYVQTLSMLVMQSNSKRGACIEDVSCTDSVACGDDNSRSMVGHRTVVSPKLVTRNAQGRNGVASRKIKKRRSSLRCARAKNPSSICIRKANGVLYSDLISVRNNGAPFSTILSDQGIRKSARRNSLRTTSQEVKSTLAEVRQDISATTCTTNILVIESDRGYRVEGATVKLEMTAFKQWFLVIKKDGIARYCHKAEKVLRPLTTNRFTLAIIWLAESGWKLEFPNRMDWLIFKELYRECDYRNMQDTGGKVIPVPWVREVTGYEDSNNATFARPDAYISFNDDELTRVMVKRAAIYDMDDEDGEWLNKFNSELCAGNELINPVSEESFELLVGTFEKGFFCSSEDYTVEKAASGICPEMERKEVIDAVYSYWMKKRKQRRSALIAIFQLYQPHKPQVVPSAALRKKRSFKRQPSRVGREKQRIFLQDYGITTLAAEHDAVCEEKAMLKIQEAKAAANKAAELAILRRRNAQTLMEKADLLAYKATMALRIAEAARVADLAGPAGSNLLDEVTSDIEFPETN